jgi:ribosomal protein L37AE/L43A
MRHPTLRQHVARAMEILSTDGVRSSTPRKGIMVPRSKRKSWMRNPKRPPMRTDVWGKQRDYALSVMIPLVAEDRTGWVEIYERASREAASSIWERIPEYLVCPECLSRAMAVRINLRPQTCRTCGERRRPVTLKGIVAWDIRRIKERLREGDIQVG